MRTDRQKKKKNQGTYIVESVKTGRFKDDYLDNYQITKKRIYTEVSKESDENLKRRKLTTVKLILHGNFPREVQGR